MASIEELDAKTLELFDLGLITYQQFIGFQRALRVRREAELIINQVENMK